MHAVWSTYLQTGYPNAGVCMQCGVRTFKPGTPTRVYARSVGYAPSNRVSQRGCMHAVWSTYLQTGYPQRGCMHAVWSTYPQTGRGSSRPSAESRTVARASDCQGTPPSCLGWPWGSRILRASVRCCPSNVTKQSRHSQCHVIMMTIFERGV